MPFVKVNQTQLFYREAGEGELLFVLPGNTASSACHTGELEYFGKNWRVVSPDFRGTGQSDWLAVWPRDWWEQCAHDVAALATALGVERFRVMGTSGGAMIALLTAILYPQRVIQVVADSCVEVLPPERLRDEVKKRSAMSPDQIGFWTFAQGPDWRAVVAADNDLLLRLADDGGDVFHGRIAQIRCPVLFTGSLTDDSTPDVAAQLAHMASQVAESQALLVNGGSHPLMWSRLDVFRRAAAAFLGAQTEL